MIHIFPSLLAASLTNLKQTIRDLEPFCPGFHLDIMDGHFVPNQGLSLETIADIRKTTSHRLWVHLMVEKPEEYYNKLPLTSGDIVSIHLEMLTSIDQLTAIKRHEWRVSLALNPTTPIKYAEPYFLIVDDILIMSVHPGFSGQKFLPESWARFDELNTLKQEYGHTFTISADGGINYEIIKKLKEKNINNVAIGSAIFTGDPVKNIQELKKIELM